MILIIICMILLIVPVIRIPVAADEADGTSESNVVDPINRDDGYSCVLYNNTNGLPTSEANDIALYVTTAIPSCA